jgi:glycosyltransferase involved in cell wall biosynthesis
MVEAMACGTPVVALKRGSAPEVVCHGVTGFVVNTLEEMMDAIGQVNHIDPKRCREYVERRFDVPRMADDYLLAYQRILEAEGKLSRTVVGSSMFSS